MEKNKEYLPQNLYAVKIGNGWVWPYGETPQLNLKFDTNKMSDKNRISNIQKAYGGTMFQVYLKEFEEEPIEDKTEWRWIPASEQLPEDMKWVLCYCRGDQHMILKLHGDEWYEDVHGLNPNPLCRAYMKSFVIAWMPLPEPLEWNE